MSEDKSALRLSGEPESQTAGEENGLPSSLPYYWSWYQLVFPGHTPPEGERGIPPQPDRE